MTLMDDYERFHGAEVLTGDVDPVYPVLRNVADALGWDREMRTRAVLAHVAYYDLGSLTRALRADPLLRFGRLPDDLPCGTERRAHRVRGRLRGHLDHLAALADEYGGAWWWVHEAVAGSPQEAWRSVTDNCLMRVNGNGRWASFKTAEMLAQVAGFPLEAPDMGHAHSSGPRRGLELLYQAARDVEGRNDPAAVMVLDCVSDEHCQRLGASLEQAETTLCDFHSLHAGRYYVGHDIDQMQDQLDRAGAWMKVGAEWWDARAASFAPEYLGERNGRTGIDSDRCRAYRNAGRLLLRSAA